MKHLILIFGLAFMACDSAHDEKKSAIQDKVVSGAETVGINNWCLKGHLLGDVLKFENISSVKLRNVEGVHVLKHDKWGELKPIFENSECTGTLPCKPQWLGLWFEFEDGNVVHGTVCSDLIVFEDANLTGAFRFPEQINLHNS